MRYNITFGALIFLILLQNIGHAQEQAGLRLDRYAGINSIALNPSFSVNFPLRWDLRLGGMDAHFNNNYGFARNTSIPKILRNMDNIRLITDTSEQTKPAAPIIIDFYNVARPTYAAFNTKIDGPAFSLKLSNQITVGVFSNYRANASSYRIAQSLSHKTYSNSGYNNELAISPFKATSMAWSEIGINLCFKTTVRQDEPFHTVGISPKILIGHQAAYANTNSRLLLSRLSIDSLSFSNGSWEYGITNGLLSPKLEASDFFDWNGRGIGFDFGYSITVPDGYSDIPEDYKLRVGVSLLDVGNISFRGKSQDHMLEFSNLSIVNTAQFNSLTQVPDILNFISETFLQDSIASRRSNEMNIGLPMGFSVQADVKFAENLYVGGYWVQRLPLLNNSLNRVNTLAIAPRYDSRWFSFSLPLTVHDYKSVQIGMAARLGYLTLGSDYVTSFVKKRALSGTNFYMSLKFNPFDIHFEKDGIKKGGRKWKGVGCYRMSNKPKKRRKR